MKIRFIAALLLATTLILVNCKNDEKTGEIPVINISDNAESKILELSDVMTIDTVIALETTPGNLVPGLVFLIPTGKYLLVIEGNTRVHQYSIDGKFIRFLLTAGRGPNEYTGISAYATDTIHQIFYYSHFGDKEHIAAVNLETGEHLERIKLPVSKSRPASDIVGSALKSLFLLPDNTLACVPYKPEGLYSLFFIDKSGKFLSGLPLDSAHFRFAAHQVGTDIHFNRTNVASDADTIYTVTNNNNIMPSIIVQLSSRDLHANETLQWEPMIEGVTKMIVRQGIFSTTYGADGSISGNRVDNIYLLIDKLNGSSFAFSKYKIGFLGDMEFAFNRSTSFGINNNEIAVKVETFEFRKHAQEILKKDDVNPKVRERMKRLMNDVADDSNPIILIGKLK